jgi:osmotically-inducible protein OsmY
MFKRQQPAAPVQNTLNIPSEEFIESEAFSRPMETSETDLRLEQQIEFELSELGAFDLESIEIAVRDGVVTIQGTVASQAESILAGNTARSVDGVRVVRNHLEVS